MSVQNIHPLDPLDFNFSKQSQCLAILGAASGLGQKKSGLELGPSLLRKTGLIHGFSSQGWEISDYGDIFADEIGINQNPWSMIERLQTKSLDAMKKKHRFLLLGGDHSVSIGSIRAALHMHSHLKVIWVDAHGDMNTPESSPSGNLHGMPLANLLGLFGEKNTTPLLPENLFLIGVRDLDSGEIQLIEKLNIQVATTQQVKTKGMYKVLSEFNLLSSQYPIHLSFDIDALDPSQASATGIHVPGGLLEEECLLLCSLIARTKALVSMDFVEINPLLATNQHELEKTLKIARKLILAAWQPQS